MAGRIALFLVALAGLEAAPTHACSRRSHEQEYGSDWTALLDFRDSLRGAASTGVVRPLAYVPGTGARIIEVLPLSSWVQGAAIRSVLLSEDPCGQPSYLPLGQPVLIFAGPSRNEPPELLTYLSLSDDLQWVHSGTLARYLPRWAESLGLRRGLGVRLPLAIAILATLMEPPFRRPPTR